MPSCFRPRSIWGGTDAALIEWAIPFYLRWDEEANGNLFSYVRIADVTYGKGRFWKGSKFQP